MTPTTTRRVTVSVSLPNKLADEAERAAKKEGMTLSGFIRATLEAKLLSGGGTK